jgi:hypothetical protein
MKNFDLVQLAYKSPLIASSISYEHSYPTFRFIESTIKDLYVYVLINRNEVVILIRAPEPLNISFKNFSLVQSIYSKNGRIGNIYTHYLDQIYEGLLEVLNRVNDRKIRILGYSIGGTLVNILTTKLIEDNFYISDVHTYGQLKPGDSVYADYMFSLIKSVGCKYTRVVSNSDIWTTLPKGFVHFIERTVITDDTGSPPAAVDPGLLESVISALKQGSILEYSRSASI